MAEGEIIMPPERRIISPAEALEIPPMLPPVPGMENIKFAFFDADNTLWPWTEIRTAGVGAMVPVIFRWLKTINKYSKATEEDVKKNMGSVYSAYGTFDIPYLVENMPIVIEHLIAATKQFQDPEKGLMYASIMLSRLVMDTVDAYRRAKTERYKPYPGTLDLLKALKTRMKIYILTDAPIEKTLKRLYDMGLLEYIDGIFGRPQPEFDKLRNLDQIKAKLPRLSPREMELLHKFHEVHEATPRHNRPEKIEGFINEIRCFIVQIFDARKPHHDLNNKVELHGYESIQSNGMIVGDNPKKDIMQAYNSDCYGVLFTRGIPSNESRVAMGEYGTDDATVGVNFPEVSDLDKIDAAQWQHKDREEEHKRRRSKLTYVDHTIQICDRTSIERPDQWKIAA